MGRPSIERAIELVRRGPSRRVRATCLAVLVVASALFVAVARRSAAPERATHSQSATRHAAAAARALAAGDANAAEAHALRALAIDPGDAEAAFALGEALAARGAPGEAREAFLRAAASAPRWPAPVVALAADDLAGGRIEDARLRLDGYLDGHLHRHPNGQPKGHPSEHGGGRPARGRSDAPLLRLRAHARRLVGDHAGSLDDLIAAGRLDPGCGRDLLEAGLRVMRSAPRGLAGEAARRRARRWLRDSARQATLHLALAPPTDGSAAATVRARALLALGEPERALVALDATSAAPRSPPRPLPPALSARRVLLRTLALDAAGRPVDALRRLHAPHPADVRAALRDALRRATAPGARPDGPRLAALIATGPTRSGDAACTEESLERHETVAAVQAARALQRGSQDARAAAVLDERLARSDRHALAWYARAALAARLGDTETAARHHREALRRDAAYWPALNDLAWLLATRLGDAAAARPLAEAAARLRPGDPVVADTLAEVRRRLADQFANSADDSALDSAPLPGDHR